MKETINIGNGKRKWKKLETLQSSLLQSREMDQ
ncbi:hypothetical protein WwAna1122, partial [Wolbachia endosymbiont of Drosophila ananassae]